MIQNRKVLSSGTLTGYQTRPRTPWSVSHSGLEQQLAQAQSDLAVSKEAAKQKQAAKDENLDLPQKQHEASLLEITENASRSKVEESKVIMI